MAVKVAINGFGRIGRLAFRQMFGAEGFEIVAINDLTSPEMLAHLLKYDSTQGRYALADTVSYSEDSITVDGKEIKIYAKANAAELPWGELGVDVVLECTGFYTSKAKAQAHIDAGAKHVIISAPAGNDLPTIVYNVNHETLSKEDHIISAASCTTNCLAPMAKALNDAFPIQTGIMCTIHAYTGDQMTLDGPQRKGDKRRSRAAAINIVPNSTGAAKAIGLVIPELNGKLIGAAQRVPTPTGSTTILTAVVKGQPTKESINAAMKDASNESFGYNTDEIVSSDVIGMTYGSLFDATQTMVLPIDENTAQVQLVRQRELLHQPDGTYHQALRKASQRIIQSFDQFSEVRSYGAGPLFQSGGKYMSLNKKSVDDINVKGLRVLVRCDFNVPLKEGKITDENRLVAALPTIKKLINDGGKVILCSHLGKPKGEPKPELSLAPVAKRLSELLGKEVKFAADPEVVGPNAKAAVAAMKDGDVVLLENTRYRAEETKNGEAFSKDLASLCDVFVDDAFGTAHRAHCSNVGVTQFVKTSVVGYLMQKEIDFLGKAVEEPVRPFVAILGGAKVADKLNVIANLLEKCDTLIIGGGMAYTFLKAQGKEIGTSLVDETKLDYCKEMMDKAKSLGKTLLLPVDTAVVSEFPNPIDAPVKAEYVSVDAIPANKMGVDIGPETCRLYSEAVKNAKTVVWNGPMGIFENPTLAAGTIAVAKALAETDATTVIGGGDSAAAVNQLGFGDKMTHISTGGGASLEFLEGKELPGVAAANDR